MMTVTDIETMARLAGEQLGKRDPLGFRAAALDVLADDRIESSIEPELHTANTNYFNLHLKLFVDSYTVGHVAGSIMQGPQTGFIHMETAQIKNWMFKGIGAEMLRRTAYVLSPYIDYMTTNTLDTEAVDYFASRGFTLLPKDVGVFQNVAKDIKVAEICAAHKVDPDAWPYGRYTLHAVADMSTPEAREKLFAAMHIPATPKFG